MLYARNPGGAPANVAVAAGNFVDVNKEKGGAHARGFNAISLGVCYEGGLDENGKAADTRTSRQKEAMHRLVSELLQRYPDAKVVGHRDLSPDTNYNGIVDPWERIKECPCFEVKAETW